MTNVNEVMQFLIALSFSLRHCFMNIIQKQGNEKRNIEEKRTEKKMEIKEESP